MTVSVSKNVYLAMNILKETGLLLFRGGEIPDLCRVVTSREIKGSWWGDPLSSEIFAAGEQLSEHPDVTVAKLVSGKVTFVHRSLWQKLAAVGKLRAEWQMKNLSAEARFLLRAIDKVGVVRTDKLGLKFGSKPGEAATELELRLLVHSDQIHTDTGYHTKMLESWEHWSERMKLRNRSLQGFRAQHFFEKRLEEINKEYSGYGQLPWQAKKLQKVNRS